MRRGWPAKSRGVNGIWCKPASAVAAVVGVLVSSPAASQSGFALNRFEPSESGSRWIAADSLEIAGHLRPSVGLVSDWAHKPLVAYSASGDEVGVLARDQLFLHLRGSLTLGDRVRVGASAPMLVYQDGSNQIIGGDEYRIQKEASLGDLRLSTDVRLFGRSDEVITLAAGAVVYFPTGSSDHFTGESAVRIQPRVQVAGEIGPFVYAARTGVYIRTRSQEIAGESLGSELTAGAATGVQFLDRKLLVGPSITAATVISEGSNDFFDRQTTPIEMQIGAHYHASPDLRLATGFGPGLSRGIGAPETRWVVAAEWTPTGQEPNMALPPDLDADGVFDGVDACPSEPGVPTADPATTGCPPPPPDRDGDGILDDADACVSEAGVASTDAARHGCPLPPDGDGDGIVDDKDACPAEAGVENLSDYSKHGCPKPVDQDSDGILDDTDACPRDAGVQSDDPKRHGCPRVIVTTERLEILDRVEFETGKAELLPEADAILSAVAAALLNHPEITRLSVEGHTDNKGRLATNRDLSTRRAAAVVEWLVNKGVARERLVSRGWGPDQPIQTNDTPEGRRNNRRVEFRVLETKDADGVGSRGQTGGAK